MRKKELLLAFLVIGGLLAVSWIGTVGMLRIIAYCYNMDFSLREATGA
jgi:hypothetical protein|nr:MAG TPA: hypothetical protein [Caudoviricetes sp.]